jgi:phospholipase/carboxylesterase
MSEDRHETLSTPDGERLIRIGPADADAAVILLHGLGADGDDLAGLVPHLPRPEGARWAFLFPEAPVRPVTLNGGMTMRAWYDIDPAAGLESGADDIRASAACATGVVEQLVADGIDAGRIVLGGFSQGGVIALEAGLAADLRLAGLVGLSTYLHDHEHADARVGLANAEAEIFLAHGRGDPMIPVARAAASRSALEDLGYRVTWNEYPMGHEVCLPEIQDLGAWLAARLPEAGS